MLDKLEQLYSEAKASLAKAASSDDLATWYRESLGTKGSIQLMTRQFGSIDAADRPAFGARINEIKGELQVIYDAKFSEMRAVEMDAEIAEGAIDITMPGRSQAKGGLHLATKNLREIYKVWGDMGFQVYRSRDVETDEYNFEMLNIPQHHPDRKSVV